MAVWEGLWRIGKVYIIFTQSGHFLCLPQVFVRWSGSRKELFHATALVQCLPVCAEVLRDIVMKEGCPYPTNLGKLGSGNVTWFLKYETLQNLYCLNEMYCKRGWGEHSCRTQRLSQHLSYLIRRCDPFSSEHLVSPGIHFGSDPLIRVAGAQHFPFGVFWGLYKRRNKALVPTAFASSEVPRTGWRVVRLEVQFPCTGRCDCMDHLLLPQQWLKKQIYIKITWGTWSMPRLHPLWSAVWSVRALLSYCTWGTFENLTKALGFPSGGIHSDFSIHDFMILKALIRTPKPMDLE